MSVHVPAADRGTDMTLDHAAVLAKAVKAVHDAGDRLLEFYSAGASRRPR